MKLRKQDMIAVAMSGGVDSSVAAYLLKKDGRRIFGIFAKTWTPTPGDGTECTWQVDRRDALRVAARLDIPLYTVDLEQEYRRTVVDALVQGYAAGQTPNPDVICNERIKFAALWEAAKSLGATKLATGHYAQIKRGQKSEVRGKNRYEYHLVRGRDHTKDQSYFLWRIGRDRLGAVLFPIGGSLKSEVRQIARDAELSVAAKKDSQGICFLGQTDLRTFLGANLPARTGEILDWESGMTLGMHQGTQFLTIGQRHRVGQTAGSARPAAQYIVDIDPQTNRVWVGPRELLYRRRMELADLAWLDEGSERIFRSHGQLECCVQIRYHQEEVRAQLREEGSRVILETSVPVFAPTPGQSAVFFAPDGVVLGGGIVAEILRDRPSRRLQSMVGSRRN